MHSMHRTILLADDHEDNRLALLTVLQREGYRTLGAANGAEAVECALEHLPYLVLMDLAMPVMDGREALRLIKQHARTSHIPVVVLTAMALSVDRDRMVAEGFAELLTKPCMPPHLIKTVHALIGPPGHAQSADGLEAEDAAEAWKATGSAEV